MSFENFWNNFSNYNRSVWNNISSAASSVGNWGRQVGAGIRDAFSYPLRTQTQITMQGLNSIGQGLANFGQSQQELWQPTFDRLGLIGNAFTRGEWQPLWQDIGQQFNEPNRPLDRDQIMSLTLMFSGGMRFVGGKVVIGETMTRVITKAEEIGAKYYIPRRTVREIGLERAIANNIRWLRTKINQGYEVIDIGINPKRIGARSPFYEAEKELIESLR